MIIAQSIADLTREITNLRSSGKRLAFVPTMGNLHAGHRRLMEEARRHAQAVVASIYVNPLQFGAGEDFAAYPRTPTLDRALLEDAGVELLFYPDDAVIYPRGREASTRVEVPGVSDILCGAARPGHFRGVATVVNRLFRLVTPDVALFGKKDYQQLLVIRLMASDFGLPVEIVGVDTVREDDGLALSSRNGYLTAEERRTAPVLYATLRTLAGQIQNQAVPSPDYAMREAGAVKALEVAGFRPDYVSIRRTQDLAVPGTGDRRLVILVAAWLGRARLIDNLEIELNPGP
jgi:pantoate--beta-alanine ligase